jgi:hypothetical protein
MTVTTAKRDWLALAALMLGFAVLFVAYYPPISGIEDETGFLNQALVWSRGAVSSEAAGLADGLVDFIEVGGRHVPARHPGRSLIVLPFLVLGGPHATFVSGLLLHLAMTVVGGSLLARLGRSPLWAVLLLCHPTLAIYSRTIMADGGAGTGLLLAGLAMVAGRPIEAGLAVGLAALMRYHAALGLPLVAGSFLVPPCRPRARADLVLCLLAGAAVGALIAGYNRATYGSIMEPFTRDRGYFSAAFLIPHARFYTAALLIFWPAMLLAPFFDRSPLRWLVRGMIVVFLGPLLVYYFHDITARWLETLIVGQRLLQVALPLWVVSYAGVLDDWLARPIRRGLGELGWKVLATAVCVGLLAANGLMFARHQAHLDGLRKARDAFVAHVPAGSLIVYQGAVPKLIGTPLEVPEYRLRALEYQGQPAEDPETLFKTLARAPRPWFLAILCQTPGETPTPNTRSLIDHFGLEPVALDAPLAVLYVAQAEP